METQRRWSTTLHAPAQVTLYCQNYAECALALSLTSLYLEGCTGITDLTPLAGQSSLTHLDLIGCTGITDLTPLAGLSNLTLLHLRACTGITDLTPLAGLSN